MSAMTMFRRNNGWRGRKGAGMKTAAQLGQANYWRATAAFPSPMAGWRISAHAASEHCHSGIFPATTLTTCPTTSIKRHLPHALPLR